MKSTSLLIIAAARAGAASLRGEGVEEVGEQIEHFPPEEFYDHVDRRSLLVAAEEEEIMGRNFYDEWPDQEVVGNIVENEDDLYVEVWRGGEDDEEEYYPVGMAPDEWAEDEVDYDEGALIVANNVEDDEEHDEYDEDAPSSKLYVRDEDSVTLVGTDLMGEPVDQYDRREAACDANKSEFRLLLRTDLYGYETKWKLINTINNQVLAQGPPPNSNYADKSAYSGRWCLSPGQYTFQMIDNGRDGICSTNPLFGCGMLRLWLNGENAGSMINDKSNWRTKDFPFIVGISSRVDGVPNNNKGNGNGNGNEGWCSKVRSVMQVPQGTCALANGRRGHRVRVTTVVDKFGKETSWKITRKNNSGNIVKMKMEPIIPANGEMSVEDCLPAGMYNFEVRDMDGICCRYGQGSFKLIVDGKELLKGGGFTKSINHDFQLGFDWISSMSDRDCEWWWAHDYRRRDWHSRCYPGQYCNKTYRHLKWSPALKADAQVYANKLLDSCGLTGIKHDETDQGENLAKNKGSGNWGAMYAADKITKRFVDNEEFWGWNGNAHLTQAMWYPSQYIGCGESSKRMSNGQACHMQVCRYAKAGNCNMGHYNSDQGNNWMKAMMDDDSRCGPMCASRDGCYH